MRMLLFHIPLFTVLFLVVQPHSFAQSEMVRSRSAQTLPTHVPLDSLSGIIGDWQGEAFGQTIEESWFSPAAGAMMGCFRMFDQEKVSFYEFMKITDTGETLLLQIKHFSSDFEGWEEKDQSEEFELLAVEDNVIYFDGLTFDLIGPDSLSIHVLMEESEGREVASFHYQRVRK